MCAFCLCWVFISPLVVVVVVWAVVVVGVWGGVLRAASAELRAALH